MEETATALDAQTLQGLGIALIFAGMLIVLAALILLLFSAAKREGKTRGAGVIIVGPIPIIFGTDKESLKSVLLLSLALTVLLLILVVVFYFVFR